MSISILTTFLIPFSDPHLINPEYVDVGSKLGYIYGAIKLLMVGMTPGGVLHRPKAEESQSGRSDPVVRDQCVVAGIC